MVPFIVDQGFFKNCEHKNTEIAIFEEEKFAFCNQCGNLNFSGRWYCPPILVTQLFTNGNDDMAQKVMRFMKEYREKKSLPYADIKEEHYREMAEIMGRGNELIEQIYNATE